MKKFAAFAMALTMTLTMAGCASKPAEPAPAEPNAEAEAPAEGESTEGVKVGVSMPTKSLQRWNQDGANMEAALKEKALRLTFNLQKTKWRHRFPRLKTWLLKAQK